MQGEISYWLQCNAMSMYKWYKKCVMNINVYAMLEESPNN